MRTAGAMIVLATTAAFALLLMDTDERQRGTDPTGASPQPTAGVPNPGRWFTATGASFRVSLATREAWAQHLVQPDPGRGRRWVMIRIDAANLASPRGDLGAPAYRLRDHRRHSYAPVVASTLGPRALSSTGVLAKAGYRTLLGFSVPATASGLRLVFQPQRQRATTIAVALSGGR